MNTFIDYLIKSSLILSVLYSLYWLLMRKDTHFRFNRMILLSILLISLLMPLINFDFLKRPEPFATLPSFTLDLNQTVVVNPVQQNGAKAIDWKSLILMLYGAGALIVMARLIIQSIYLYAVSKLSKVIHAGKIKIVLMNADITPFAYFNRVYVPALKFRESSMEAILKHEHSHLEQMHYIDIFLIQVLTIMQWFNPFAWLFEKSLKETHEYLADEAVLQQGLDQGMYQALLVNEAVGGPVFTITSQFNKSLIKKRIIMMTKMKTPRLAQLKVFLFVPACAFFLLAFAAPERTIQPILEKGQDLLSKNLTTPNLSPQVQDTVVKLPDVMPEFPGGEKELQKFLASNVRYPVIALEKEIAGRVILQFIVTKTGKIQNVKVLRGIGGGCDEEAVRVVKMMPSWKPGLLKGQPVNVYFTLPVMFSLKESSKKDKTTGEEMTKPQFPGGMDSLISFINRNMNYPETAVKNGIIGMVVTQFQISKDGEVKNATVVRSLEKQCDEEALRVINSMPKWIPGKKDGENVETNIRIPVYFNTQKNNTLPQKASVNTGEPLTFVEQMPTYPGGIEALQRFLSSNIRYPAIATKMNITGKVIIQFIISKIGKVEKVKVLRGIGGGCDEEAVRVVNMMPDWKPGMEKGEPVPVYFTLPVVFSLKDSPKVKNVDQNNTTTLEN